jgi:hypothetical protein
LIEKGANVNAKDDAHQTPLELAYGNERMETVLRAAGAREPRFRLTENHVVTLGIIVMMLAVLNLLPVTRRLGRLWEIGLTVAPLGLYVAYEYLMLTRFPHINIRIDVLVIWPLLATVVVKAIYRSTRLSHK